MQKMSRKKRYTREKPTNVPLKNDGFCKLFFFAFCCICPFSGRHSLIFRGGTVIGYDMICIRTSLPKTNWKPRFGTTLTSNSLSHSPLLNLLVGDFNPLEKY